MSYRHYSMVAIASMAICDRVVPRYDWAPSVMKIIALIVCRRRRGRVRPVPRGGAAPQARAAMHCVVAGFWRRKRPILSRSVI